MKPENQSQIRCIIGTNTVDMAQKLVINTELTCKILVEFIRDGMAKAGFQKVVLGLSGGIDSALVAFLAVQALGSENVIGVRMPYQLSSEGILSDAQKIIDRLRIQTFTIPITQMVKPLIAFTQERSTLRKGNI